MPGLLIKGVTWGTLGLAFLGIAAAPWGLHCSFIERLTHVRFYWIGALLGLLIWCTFRRRWLPALVAVALLVAALPAVLRYFRSGGVSTVAGTPLVVGSWNVHSSKPERGRGLSWLKDCPADVLLLTEVNPGWAKYLKEASARWPHQICEPRNGAAGIWLLSRWPLTRVETAGISRGEERPWIGCTVETPAGNVRVMGMHPRTPRGGYRFHERNAQLDRAADFAAAAAGPVVVLGDFNCTPFSPWFDRLVERGRLRDAALGHGLKPTWQSGIWVLPIDHILTGGPLGALDWQVHGDNLGSDHSPVMATLTWIR